MVQLRRLVQIGRNVEKLKDPQRVKKALAPVFETLLAKGYSRFSRRLREKGAGTFPNSIASGRLRNSFERDIRKVLRFDSHGRLLFSFRIASTPPTRRTGDPAAYYDALDEASLRSGGPSKARVRQWLEDRGIISPGQVTVARRGGKRSVSVRWMIYLVQRSIWRKTRTRQYKSLGLTKLLASVIDIANNNSDIRQGVRKQFSLIFTADQ